MPMRKFALISLVFLMAVTLSGCGKKATSDNKPNVDPAANNAKLMINVLEPSRRPFVAIVPHSTGKLLTLYLTRVASEVKSASIDIEYLAGNSLKGGRVSPVFPIPSSYAQGFILGSCSTGGKCSFDKDLLSGTMKTRLDFNDGPSHLLKSEYVFVNGPVTTPDGKVSYTPQDPKQKNQIVVDTQGLPQELSGDLAFSPVAITSVSNKDIQGDLKIRAAGVSKAQIFDGEKYVDLRLTVEGDYVLVKIDETPWHQKVEITRDDLKGSKESIDLYIVGPIVLLK